MREDSDLGTLDNGELVCQVHDDLCDGLADEIAQGTAFLLSRAWDAQEAPR